MTSDGDALFAGAVLTCIRGTTPSDGGAAVSALADWLTEQFQSGSRSVALADPTSGIGLTVFHRPGLEHSYRVHYTAEDNDDDLTQIGKIGGYSDLLADFSDTGIPDFGTDFRKIVQHLWKGEAPD